MTYIQQEVQQKRMHKKELQKGKPKKADVLVVIAKARKDKNWKI